MRYAICGALLGLAIIGTYSAGYAIGSQNARIKYITKEVEVVKYVGKQKDKIYSLPVNTPDNLIRLFNEGKL